MKIVIILIQTNSILIETVLWSPKYRVSLVTEFFTVEIMIIQIQTSLTLTAYSAVVTRVLSKFCKRIFYSGDRDNSNSNEFDLNRIQCCGHQHMSKFNKRIFYGVDHDRS